MSLKALAYLRENYVLLPLIPVLIGSIFIVSYCIPLGPHVIQTISYLDIFKFTFVFSAVLIVFVFMYLVSYISIINISEFFKLDEVSRNKYLMRALLICVLIVVLIPALPSLGLYEKLLMQVNAIIAIILSPIILSILNISSKSETIFNSILVLSITVLLVGVQFGSFDRKFIDIDDEVCSDKCNRLGVYAILSDYIIAADDKRRTVLIPTAEVKWIRLNEPARWGE